MNLFQDETISSISFDQDEILQNIVYLHCAQGFECDATYGYGGFYKKLPSPRLRFDLEPKVDGVTKASSTDLPLEDASITSLMYDPPFMASWNKNTEDYVMAKKYGFVKGIKNLWKMYDDSLKEFHRVLQSQGILVVKCQDTVYSGKQYFSHMHIHNTAVDLGFHAKDLFILLAKNRFTGNAEQKNARKYHSYFWVFKKKRFKAITIK